MSNVGSALKTHLDCLTVWSLSIMLYLKPLLDFAFQCLGHLGALVNKIAEFGLLDWSGRVKLIDCICYFVLVTPQVGQVITIS